MTVQTYALLQADAALAIGRTDLTARIVEFIAQAEFRLTRDLFTRGFRNYASSTFTAGEAGAVIDLPVRFLRMRSFDVLANAVGGTATGSTRNPVLWREHDFIRAVYPLQSTTGRPQFWTGLDQDQALVAPAPNVAYAYRLAYYEKLAVLSAGNTTNWITANAPDIMLYATLCETAPYLRDDERVPMWQAEYEKRVKALAVVEKQYQGSEASQTVGMGG